MLLEAHWAIPTDSWTVRPGDLDHDASPAIGGLLGSLATTAAGATTAAESTDPGNRSTSTAHRGHDEARRGLDIAKAWLDRCEITATPTEYGRALEGYRKATELFAKVNRELNASDESKFLKSTRWRAIVNTLLDALRPVPGALGALSKALKEIDGA